jgi:protein-disulfide isomerase
MLLAAAIPLAAAIGCDQATEAEGPERAAPDVTWEREDGEVEREGQEVVALIEGEVVTADQMDAPIRLSLYQLDLLRHRLRLRRLQDVLVEKVLGPRAEAEGLSLEAYLAKHARQRAQKQGRDERRAGEEVAPAGMEGAGPSLLYREDPQQNAFILKALEEEGVRILMEAPELPVLDVRLGDNPIRGKPDAPVTILVFSDFQSPHSARVQPTLRRILEEHREEVRLVIRDLPLRFHRYAPLAAEAAECAGEQNAYWKYHDLLFQNQSDLTRPALARYARRASLDLDRFQACLKEGRFKANVAADAAEAERLGIKASPTFFVNGRYMRGVRGVPPFAAFERIVRSELGRLGLARAVAAKEGERAGEKASGKPEDKAEEALYAEAEPTDLPLALVGTLVRKDPDRSVASIRREGEAIAGAFRPGDEIMDGVTLARVERRRAYLRRNGDLEFLPIARRAAGAAREAKAPPPVARESRSEARGRGGEEGAGEAEQAGEPLLPGPDAVLAVTRGDLEEALEDVEALDGALETGDLDADGKKLLRVSDVTPGSLYEKLGLLPNDVLMQVNGMWIHDQDNPLWNALAGDQNTVILRIIRDGIPKTFEYQIE